MSEITKHEGDAHPQSEAQILQKKEKLVNEILDLQQTLGDLTDKVEKIKSENQALKDENYIYKEYIDNLMTKVGNVAKKK